MSQKGFTDEYLLYLLAQASAEVSAQFHAELKAVGVPVLNWRILASLYPSKKLTINALSGKAMANQTTMTRAIDRLEAAGTVDRIKGSEDRRQVHVVLTDTGREQAGKLVEMANAHERKILSNHSKAEVAALKKILANLRAKV